MNTLPMTKPEESVEYVTLNCACWIHEPEDESADPVVLVTDPSLPKNQVWNGHTFVKFEAGERIPNDLYRTEWIHGHGQIYGM